MPAPINLKSHQEGRVQQSQQQPQRPAFKPRPADWQDREVSALARLWNRSDPDSRQEFLDMANESDGGIIDP